MQARVGRGWRADRGDSGGKVWYGFTLEHADRAYSSSQQMGSPERSKVSGGYRLWQPSGAPPQPTLISTRGWLDRLTLSVHDLAWVRVLWRFLADLRQALGTHTFDSWKIAQRVRRGFQQLIVVFRSSDLASCSLPGTTGRLKVASAFFMTYAQLIDGVASSARKLYGGRGYAPRPSAAP